jgi:hypothetical protein
MRAVIAPDNSPVICFLRVRWISGGRTGELDFTIFQGASGTGGPWRAVIEHEISPPPPRSFIVPLQSLEKKAHIEHGGLSAMCRSAVSNTFNVQRHLMSRRIDSFEPPRINLRTAAHQSWSDATAAGA